MIICQTCTHHPGISRLCFTGRRHATAAPKKCKHYTRDHFSVVGPIRAAAVDLYNAGMVNAYARVLAVAHSEAKQ